MCFITLVIAVIYYVICCLMYCEQIFAWLLYHINLFLDFV